MLCRSTPDVLQFLCSAPIELANSTDRSRNKHRLRSYDSRHDFRLGDRWRSTVIAVPITSSAVAVLSITICFVVEGQLLNCLEGQYNVELDDGYNYKWVPLGIQIGVG